MLDNFLLCHLGVHLVLLNYSVNYLFRTVVGDVLLAGNLNKFHDNNIQK